LRCCRTEISNLTRRSILAAIISTLEVLSIIAVFIYTSLRPEALDSEPSRGVTLKEKALRAWFWFLFISPFVTGTMVVLMASDISCDPEDDLDMHQPICQVGIRLIKATALCRAGIMYVFSSIVCSPPVTNTLQCNLSLCDILMARAAPQEALLTRLSLI
jgi:hypothetical protein